LHALFHNQKYLLCFFRLIKIVCLHIRSIRSCYLFAYQLPQELLLRCADAELSCILGTVTDPATETTLAPLFEFRTTLNSNRATFLGSNLPSSPPSNPAQHCTDPSLSSTPQPTSTQTEHRHPSPTQSTPPADCSHQLQLVLRFACALRALGSPLSPARSGYLAVVLSRLLRNSPSLPAYVHALHLLPSLGIKVRLRQCARYLCTSPELCPTPAHQLGYLGASLPVCLISVHKP